MKIAHNIAKVGVHASISNRPQNLWSNFNFEKLVRSETASCILSRVLKGVQIAWNNTKVGVQACISNGHPNLLSNFNSKNLVKSEALSCGFSRVVIKGGQNRSKR